MIDLPERIAPVIRDQQEQREANGSNSRLVTKQQTDCRHDQKTIHDQKKWSTGKAGEKEGESNGRIKKRIGELRDPEVRREIEKHVGREQDPVDSQTRRAGLILFENEVIDAPGFRHSNRTSRTPIGCVVVTAGIRFTLKISSYQRKVTIWGSWDG